MRSTNEMWEGFSWATAGAVFVTYFVIDVIYALYIICVGRRQPVRAALLSSALYSLGACGVVTVLSNLLYVIPLAAGAFLGTWVIISRDRRGQG